MKFSGLARTETEIVNLTQTAPSGLKGISGVLGITEFGEPNKPKLVGSWIEYQRNFGGLIAGSEFPKLCKRALDAGARLRVCPVAHYTDIDDATTIEGTYAAGGMTDGVHTNVYTSKWIGTAGNKIVVTVTAPANGVVNTMDMTVAVEGYTGEIEEASISSSHPVLIEGMQDMKGIKNIDLLFPVTFRIRGEY